MKGELAKVGHLINTRPFRDHGRLNMISVVLKALVNRLLYLGCCVDIFSIITKVVNHTNLAISGFCQYSFVSWWLHAFGSQDFRLLLDENPELLLKLRDLTINWVQEGFQDFFRKLDDSFLLISGKKNTACQDVNSIEEMSGERISAGLVLVLAQLTLFIEQSAILRINEARSQLHPPPPKQSQHCL